MNRRIHRVLVGATGLLVLAAAACTDLTVEPKSTATDANVFTDPASYRAFIAKVYAGLAVTGQQGAAGQPDIEGIDEGFSQYLRIYWEAQELPTDEAVIAWGDVGLPELNTQLWAVDNSFVVAMYYRIFYQVVLANEFLRQTTDAKLASRGVGQALYDEIQGYRAEARFLRALSYWHGIDFFGDVPLITEDEPIGTTPVQSTRTAVYDFIVSELNDILTALPPPGPSTYGRATGPAARMLLAKVYLNAGVYTGTTRSGEALTAAEAVIANPAFSLDANYRDLFLADNHTSPEIIFAIPQDGLRTQTWGGMTFMVHASCGGSMDAGEYGIDGCWWGLRLKPEAYNRFAAGDQRAAYFYTSGQSVTIGSISNFNDGIAAPKFANRTSGGGSGAHPTHVDTDFPMFRLADAYLIYAEAHLRGGGGNATTALDYVNALRVRAYGDSSGVITAPELTLDFILDERGRELLWEAHRRSDLVRYGRFTGGSYIWSWKGGTQAGTATGAHLDLYPIPANELIANPNLRQNPGY